MVLALRKISDCLKTTTQCTTTTVVAEAAAAAAEYGINCMSRKQIWGLCHT